VGKTGLRYHQDHHAGADARDLERLLALKHKGRTYLGRLLDTSEPVCRPLSTKHRAKGRNGSAPPKYFAGFDPIEPSFPQWIVRTAEAARNRKEKEKLNVSLGMADTFHRSGPAGNTVLQSLWTAASLSAHFPIYILPALLFVRNGDLEALYPAMQLLRKGGPFGSRLAP
jgi:hypothetical protein